MPSAIRRIRLATYGVLLAYAAIGMIGASHYAVPAAVLFFPIALIVGWAQYASP